MKHFHGNILYRGRSFDVSYCAKSTAEAARIMDCSTHHIKTYFSAVSIEKPYEGIKAVPYGHYALLICERGKEYDYEDVKKIVDKDCKKQMKKLYK